MNLENSKSNNNYGSINIKFDYLPIVIILIYLSASYIMHFILNKSESLLLLLFIIITHSFILFGYLLASNHNIFKNREKSISIVKWKFDKKIEKLIMISMVITIINCIYTISYYYSGVDNILDYLLNPGKAYEYVKFIRNHPEFHINNIKYGSVISIFLTLTSATKYIYLTLSILYWKNLKLRSKLIFLITTILYLVQSLLIGAMITIAGILLSCIPMFLKYLRVRKTISDSYETNYSLRKARRRRRRTLIFMVIFAILIMFFIGNRIDENSSIIVGFTTLMFYFSHGYIGLEYCLKLPIKLTFGFTTFRGITSYFIENLRLDDPFLNSYLIRNELTNGWPAMSLWSTIYPWLASDFTFFMVPIIMGFISYKFGLLWNKTIHTENPYGYLLLGQLFIFWFMIPANNQLFHTLGNASSFLLILLLYYRSKKLERRKRRYLQHLQEVEKNV